MHIYYLNISLQWILTYIYILLVSFTWFKYNIIQNSETRYQYYWTNIMFKTAQRNFSNVEKLCIVLHVFLNIMVLSELSVH